MNTEHKDFDGLHKPTGPVIQVHVGGSNPLHRPSQITQPKKRRWLKITLYILLLAFMGAGGFVIAKSSLLSSKIFVGSKAGIFQQVTDAIKGATGTISLQGEKDGQINVLLLGIGGAGHDGPYLSDTMILAQIRPQDQEISLTSIPRDYYINLKEFGGEQKINAAFANGYYKSKNWDEAGKVARTVVGKLAGVDIPYFAVIDFQGFEKAINQVGGVDVVVERTFTDYKYPDSGTGYLPPQTFTEGPAHLDGTKALIFSRSRHAAGPEGSDFARSARQHKVIQAFKEKVVSLNLITDIGTVNNLVNTFAEHFHTNLSAGELFHLYSLSKDFSKDTIVATSLDPSTKLICPNILESNGAYVLQPCPGKTDKDIVTFFKNSFNLGKLSAEKSVVWIATNNPQSRGYKQTERKLLAVGLTVWPITYTDIIPEETAIYQVNQKPATLAYIKNILDAREVTVPPPGLKIDTTRADIIVILGTNLPLDPIVTPPPPSNKTVPQEDPADTDQTPTTPPPAITPPTNKIK